MHVAGMPEREQIRDRAKKDNGQLFYITDAGYNPQKKLLQTKDTEKIIKTTRGEDRKTNYIQRSNDTNYCRPLGKNYGSQQTMK